MSEAKQSDSTDLLGQFLEAAKEAGVTRLIPTHPEDIRAALDVKDAEILRLKACLDKANAQAERFERGWYLRGDALEKLQRWADAYPLTVFPEPDFAKAHGLLQAGGMTLDAISASNMRHVINGVRETVAEGLMA